VSDVRVRRIRSGDLTAPEIEAIRSILWAAFGDDPHDGFTEDDWQHALGGTHVVAEIDGQIVAHASVVPRELRVAGRPLATGYVEAVAVEPGRQGSGLGTTVMREAAAIVGDFELGALGTGEHHFYERLGWRTWRGPSSVRTTSGERATPDEDGYILVLATPTSPVLDLDAPISCEWRPGDVW
jgi:aminoglycoside 2'-N-acetyltransferase I